MILSTILGLITGLGGNVVTGIFNYKMQKLKLKEEKLKYDHEIGLIKAETDAMVTEARAKVEAEKAKIEGEVELADAKVYGIVEKTGGKRLVESRWVEKLLESKWTSWLGIFLVWIFGLIDAVRWLMRPTLTAYLVALSTWLTVVCWKMTGQVQGGIDSAQALGILREALEILMYLTVSCVTWWFGDRRMEKFLMH